MGMRSCTLLSHHDIWLGAYRRNPTKAGCVGKSHFLERIVLIDDASNKRSNLTLPFLEYPNALVAFVSIQNNILEECSEVDGISGSPPFHLGNSTSCVSLFDT
jgi:hypothetical protein